MKLRIRENSVRLRLDQRDLQVLHSNGRVEEGIRFGTDPARLFSYAVEVNDGVAGDPEIDYVNGQFVVRISPSQTDEWVTTNRVGFENQMEFEGTTVRLLIEKDFACLDRPAGEEADDRFAFPNPSASCQPGEG